VTFPEKVGELFGLTQTGIEGINEKVDRNIFVICHIFFFFNEIGELMGLARRTTSAIINTKKGEITPNLVSSPASLQPGSLHLVKILDTGSFPGLQTAHSRKTSRPPQ